MWFAVLYEVADQSACSAELHIRIYVRIIAVGHLGNENPKSGLKDKGMKTGRPHRMATLSAEKATDNAIRRNRIVVIRLKNIVESNDFVRRVSQLTAWNSTSIEFLHCFTN